MRRSSAKSADVPDIVVIGGSAGSVRFLLSLAPAFAGTIRIPLVVVIHRMRNEESKLDQVLDFRLGIPVREAGEKELIEPGIMYVAPPNYHLLLEDDRTFALADMEMVKHSRPSIDVTFTSVAEVYGAGAAGILLSGANSDGSDGLAAIAENGGRIIAQDPKSAELDTMPQAAIDALPDCEVMGQAEMTRLVEKMVSAWRPPVS